MGDCLGTRPYTLTGVDSDLADVLASLGDGAAEHAAEAYPGPLLPSSGVPAIAAARHELATLISDAKDVLATAH